MTKTNMPIIRCKLVSGLSCLIQKIPRVGLLVNCSSKFSTETRLAFSYSVALCFELFLLQIYTPTVGWACLNYHLIYRRPRGMFFSAADRGEMASMVWNWPHQKVRFPTFAFLKPLTGQNILFVRFTSQVSRK